MSQFAARHKVFVSYHHANDQAYRDRFEHLFDTYHGIMVPKSVDIGDIPPNLPTETVRQKIREEYLRDSSVTVVLVGAKTWQRKHVDWEIGSSIRHTDKHPRSGLLGIFLPTYPRENQWTYDPYTIPPRLYDNVTCKFASLHDWSEDPATVAKWIDEAFRRRDSVQPNNGRLSFAENRSGDRWSP